MYLPDTHLVHHRSMDNIGTWRKKRRCGWEQPKSDSPTHPKSVKEPDKGDPSREVPVPHRHQYRFWGKIDLVYMQSLALGVTIPVPSTSGCTNAREWHYQAGGTTTVIVSQVQVVVQVL